MIKLYHGETMYELACVFDSRKSFYRKAFVKLNENGVKELYSYETKVAYLDEYGVPHLLYNYDYSPTTLRHVKEFIRQAGYKIDTSSKLWKMYGNLHIAENYNNALGYKVGIV